MSKETNNFIDKLIEVLKGFKTPDAKPPVRVKLESNMISCGAEIDVDKHRISMFEIPGGTKMDFQNRKVETIEGFAKCFLQAVDIARKSQP
jgi:hypothetical protein